MNYKKSLDKLNNKGAWNMIVIDGVVGVGKSTLMKILNNKGYIAFPEPVIDNPILEKFYYDRERYSFPLQIFFLNKRFKHIKEASLIENAVMDRSIYGDIIFAKMLMESGEMAKEEFDIYLELFENMLEHCKPPKLMIYLDIDVDNAINRIQKRGRDYELIVEREYWEKLNTNYNEFFNQYDHSPILRIDVNNIDFENNKKDLDYVLSIIENKLKEIERSI